VGGGDHRTSRIGMSVEADRDVEGSGW
jgi:hypothetical protein